MNGLGYDDAQGSLPFDPPGLRVQGVAIQGFPVTVVGQQQPLLARDGSAVGHPDGQ